MIEIPDLDTVARALRFGMVRMTMTEWLELDADAQELLAELGDRVSEIREARIHRVRCEGLHEVTRDRADGGAGRRKRILATHCARAVAKASGANG